MSENNTRPQGYQPTLVQVDLVKLQNLRDCAVFGQEYARESLREHDTNLGRSTLKNKRAAEAIEGDIRLFDIAIKQANETLS